MPTALKPSRTDDDIALLRRAFDVARRAQLRGNHPFGAILADANGEFLLRWKTASCPIAT